MEENKILAYVRGNDVLFIVTVTTPERDEYGQPVYGDDELQLIPVDFTGWDDYSLRVVKQGVTRTIVAESSQLVEGEDGKIVVDVPYTAQCGTYSLELVGRQNGRHERSYEIMMFAIVESNDKANLVYEIIDGYKSTDLDITVQMVSSALVYGENAYQMWKHLPGNEDKTLQDYIDEVLGLTTITENARHPDYVGEDNYVYRWDTETQSYYNTDIYVKGEQGEKGDKGDKGDTGATGATGAQGIQGEQGEKGDPFTYSDFTAEQLAALRGPQGDKGDKGDPMRYEDLSPAQIESLKGPKGDKGDTGATGATGATGPAGQDGADGTDGVTPHIDPTTKHWMIGNTDTGIVAEGTTPDLSNYVQKSSTAGLLKNDGTVDTTSYGTYSKPSTGIPSTDLSSAVQTSLGKADTAYQDVENLNDVVIGTEQQTTTIQSTQIWKPNNVKHVNIDYFYVIENGDRIQATAETGYGIYCGIINNDGTQFIKSYTDGYVDLLDIIYDDEPNQKVRIIVKKMDGTNTTIQDVEDNTDISVTRTTPASGLVYDVEELKKKKPSIKALFIGNSVCQDHVAYLPWLLKNIYGDSINFEIYLAYKGGATIKYYVDNIITGNVPVEIFSHAKDTDVWTNTNNFAYANIWTSHGPFDLICYEGYFNHGSSSDGNVEDTSSFMTFIDDLKTRQTEPFKLGYLIHQTYTSSTHTEADAWARILAGAEYAVNNTPVSILFPCGVVTKLVNGDIPQSTLSNDNIHNQQGLPCIMGAYTLVEELARYMGLPSRILNNSLRITQSIEASLNIPGPNGTLQVGTDAQYSLCQNVAIEAIKYSDELFLNISGKANSSDLATVATSGSYNDLSDTPTIPDISGKEDKVDIVSASGATLSAEVGKYYTLSNVGTLAITLPTIASGTTKVQTVTFYIAAGSTPAVTFTSTHSIYYSDGFEIAASSTYEVSAAYNGIAWVVASVKIVIPT